jgi:hypothetical protein
MTIFLDMVEQTRNEALRILNHQFQPGDQVRYVPEHAHKNPNDVSCETGIVTSDISKSSNFVYVRYFRGTYLQATPEMTHKSNLQYWGEPLKLQMVLKLE